MTAALLGLGIVVAFTVYLCAALWDEISDMLQQRRQDKPGWWI